MDPPSPFSPHRDTFLPPLTLPPTLCPLHFFPIFIIPNVQLTRLHVFTVGNCVYQVSNYCSWPTLASLLQPSPPDTPTTARSLCSSPIRGCHFHNATPEPPQSHLSSRHACASPDATRPALQAWKRAGLRCCDGYSNCGGECPSRPGWRLSGRSSPNLPGPVKLEESATRIIFRQICEGLRHLHDHGLLHRYSGLLIS